MDNLTQNLGKAEITITDPTMLGTIEVSDKIKLTPLNPELAAEHFEIIDTNREFFGQWFDWVDSVQSVQDSAKYIHNSLQQGAEPKYHTFHIIYEDILVGQISIFGIKKGSSNGEIGYWLDQASNGAGIMTNSVKAILEYGFLTLNLHRIEIRCDPDNTNSRKIPIKLGFNHEGALRESVMFRGKFRNTIIYALLDSEFENLQHSVLKS